MNVNPESNRYGEVVAWDSLTEAERQSGDWLKLPSHDESGQPIQARKVSLLEKAFAPRQRDAAQREALERLDAHFERMRPVSDAWNAGGESLPADGARSGAVARVSGHQARTSMTLPDSSPALPQKNRGKT